MQGTWERPWAGAWVPPAGAPPQGDSAPPLPSQIASADSALPEFNVPCHRCLSTYVELHLGIAIRLRSIFGVKAYKEFFQVVFFTGNTMVDLAR